MKAIFIDAVNRKVEDVNVENELHAFYRQLGCEMIEVVPLGGKFLLIVDEEGKLRDWKAGFRFHGGSGIAGNGLIVCEDGNGDFADVELPAGLVAEFTEFLDLEKHPLPPPAFGFAPLTDLTPESIENARAEALRDLERQR